MWSGERLAPANRVRSHYFAPRRVHPEFPGAADQKVRKLSRGFSFSLPFLSLVLSKPRVRARRNHYACSKTQVSPWHSGVRFPAQAMVANGTETQDRSPRRISRLASPGISLSKWNSPNWFVAVRARVP